eukprot:TRINITY_DN150_c2_g1_i1.p1 TRINITY_DN150_c2_g1~~TRINITY_DN150_c2_g1_i1.p1  ORF type:complete len:210 (-),score=29.61 TRINITY_DN150_c2_g1_i1:283-912(-)
MTSVSTAASSSSSSSRQIPSAVTPPYLYAALSSTASESDPEDHYFSSSASLFFVLYNGNEEALDKLREYLSACLSHYKRMHAKKDARLQKKVESMFSIDTTHLISGEALQSLLAVSSVIPISFLPGRLVLPNCWSIAQLTEDESADRHEPYCCDHIFYVKNFSASLLRNSKYIKQDTIYFHKILLGLDTFCESLLPELISLIASYLGES